MKIGTPIRPGSKIAAEFWRTGRSRTCPVYNMHAHLGDFPSMDVPRATRRGWCTAWMWQA